MTLVNKGSKGHQRQSLTHCCPSACAASCLLRANSATFTRHAGFAKLHVGLMVLVKRMSVFINFYCKIPNLCQSLVKSAQILLVMSDRTNTSRELCICLSFKSRLKDKLNAQLADGPVWRDFTHSGQTIFNPENLRVDYIIDIQIGPPKKAKRANSVYMFVKYM